MTTATMDRAAWLEERRQGVGASDVAGIGGVSPWSSPWSVWADKCGLTPLDDTGAVSQEMVLGRDLEPVIADWFHRSTGLYVDGAQTMVHHEREPRWFATLDGYVVDGADSGLPLGVYEAKYTPSAPWDEVPTHYLWQVQWQLLCTGLTQAWLAVLHLPYGRPRFQVYEVARDGELIHHITGTVERFWQAHVVTGRPPLADDSAATAAAIDAAWGHVLTTQEPVLDLTTHAALVDDYATCKRARSLLDKKEQALATQLRAVFGSSDPELSEGHIAGALACSWRSQTRTTVDADAVRRDHGSAYDRTTTGRVLRLHGDWKP